MKYVVSLFSFLAIAAAFSVNPVVADDGNVPQSVLADLGLAGMKTVSDAEGMQVRGMSSNAMSMGLSLVTGLLIDPATKSFVFGVDANAAMASAENAGLQVLSTARHIQASSVNLNLTVTTNTSFFTGVLTGGAGGSGFASGQ